jgi:hypothetical protein
MPAVGAAGSDLLRGPLGGVVRLPAVTSKSRRASRPYSLARSV